MPRLTATGHAAAGARPGAWRAARVSLASLVRAVPLLVASAPRTPLRVLCVAALDTVRVLRRAPPLSPRRRQLLAAFLDLQACLNAEWDGKPVCATACGRLRQRVVEAGLEPWLSDYVVRLRELEARRPSIGGDRRHFDRTRAYREDVARLALAAIAGLALDAGSLAASIQATHDDGDLAALFRIAMQCQIVDDVVDYREDRAAGLPSFLTASASLPRALAWTAVAVRSYGDSRGIPGGAAVFPVRAALRAVTAVASLATALRAVSSRAAPAPRSSAPASRRAATR